MGRPLPNSTVAVLSLPLLGLIAMGCKTPEPQAPEDLAEVGMSVESDLGELEDLHPREDLVGAGDLTSQPDLASDLAGADGCGDTSADPRNCGVCGNRCAEGHICCSGVCRDAMNDPANCRTCGHSCGGNACCGGLCTSLSTPRNCGACGQACAAGQSCCGGACVDTRRDPAHCGGCGLACSGGRVCAEGGCYAADGGLPDMSGPGCLDGGRTPPAVCLVDKDPMSGAPYTICRADCLTAWVAHAEPGGGRFAHETICRSLGYARADQWGGTCGDTCGYCEGRMSNCMRTGKEHYDGGGSCGADCLQVTVMWRCAR